MALSPLQRAAQKEKEEKQKRRAEVDETSRPSSKTEEKDEPKTESKKKPKTDGKRLSPLQRAAQKEQEQKRAPVVTPIKPTAAPTPTKRRTMQDIYTDLDAAQKRLDRAKWSVDGFAARYGATSDDVWDKMAERYGATKDASGTYLFQDQSSLDEFNRVSADLSGLYDTYKREYDTYSALYDEMSNFRTADSVGFEVSALEDEKADLLRQRAVEMDVYRVSGDATKLVDIQNKIKVIDDKLEPLLAEQEELKALERQDLIDSGEYHDANLWDLTGRSVAKGYLQARQGQETYKAMKGWDNKKAEFDEKLAQEKYQFLPDGKLEEFVSGGAELAGQFGRQYSDPRALLYALESGALAMLAGNAGPQALVPEEIVSVPTAIASGFQIGGAQANYEIEAGHAYNEMIDMGISPKTASIVAEFVGGGNALLEMVQMDDLLKSFKALKSSAATQNAAKMIGEYLENRGVHVLTETGQEVAQEAVTMLGGEVASRIDKGESAYTQDEVVERLGDTAVSSAGSFAFMGLPGDAVNITSQAYRGKQYADLGEKYEYDGAADEIIASGLEASEETDAHKIAVELQQKQARGETITNEEIGRAVEANARAIAAEERIAEANAEPQETIEDAAREVADMETKAAQEALKWAESVPYNAMSDNNVTRLNALAVKSSAEELSGYGKAGAKAFYSILENSDMEPGMVRKEFQSAYEAGMTNLPREMAHLGSAIQEKAYTAGQLDSILSMQKKKTVTIFGKENGFIENDASKVLSKQEVSTFHAMGKRLGTKIMMEEQVYGGRANGSYKDGVIRIAKDAANPYVVVAKHEITHRMQELAPAEYTKYRNYAVQIMSAARNMTGTTLVEAYQDRAAEAGVALSTEQAMDEIAADFTEKILTDKKSLHDFVNSAKESVENRTRVQKFFDAVREFINKIKRVFNGDKAKMDKAARDQFGATVEQLENAERLWKEAYRAAEKNVSEAVSESTEAKTTRDGKLFRTVEADGTIILETSVGNPVAMMTEDGSAQFSLKTYEAFGRAELKRWLTLKESKGQVTKEEAKDIIRQLDEYYDLCQKFTDKYAPFGAWSNAEVVRDNKGKPVFSVVKANGEYAMNLDFSLVCKKRRTLDAVFMEMIRRGIMDDISLEEADIAKVNEIIRENGFETACALCFVDSKRYRQGKVADTFVTQYNDIVRQLIPAGGGVKAHHFDFVGSGVYKDSGTGLHTLSDAELQEGIEKLKRIMRENGKQTVAHKIAKHLLNTPKDRKLMSRSDFMNTDGFGAVKLKNPAVLKLYNSSKGAGGPKAAFSDVQYLGEILQKNNFTPARAYAVGGVRIQSFSDYIPRLVFDYLQMVGDLSAKKLPAHAYTKEAIFVKQFGLTGIKMNMSLVPAVAEDGVAAGLDKNGDYLWYDGQSFGSDVKVKGSGKTGFDLAVQIQNAPGYSKNCGTVAVGVSREHILKMLDDEDIRMIIPYHKSSLNHIVAVMNNIDKYTDYTKVQNTRMTVVDENGNQVLKKISGKDFNFNEALRRTGDAKAAAAEYLAWCKEKGYTPKFDEFAKHDNYYKVLEDFATYDNGVAAPQGAVTMTFPKAGDAFGSMAELIEQGLEEDAILEADREASVPKIVDQVEKALKKKDTTQYSLKDRDYAKAVKSGDMETAQRMVDEAAKAAGYAVRLYHGTKMFGFTKFDPKFSDDKISIFASTSNDVAQSYSGTYEIKRAGTKPKTYRADKLTDAQIREALSSWHKFERVTGAEAVQGCVAEAIAKNAAEIIRQVEYRNKTADEYFAIPAEYSRVLSGKVTPYKIAEMAEMFTEEQLIAKWGKNAPGIGAAKTIGALAAADYGQAAYVARDGKGNASVVMSEQAAAEEAARSLNAKESNGNYALYGNTDGMLVIDGKGANWNDIPFSHVDGGRSTTRNIVAWAHKRGYTGVVFKNIVDNANFGRSAKASTVYAFFSGNQLKSADPVTYDRFGRTIPLSKRFNAKNKDIRYSLKDSDYMAAVEAGDMETAQKMVDEAAKAAGFPAKLYHGTPQFGFTRADVSKSDDGISFFATDSLEVAQTYSGKDKVKQLSDDAHDDIDAIEEAFRDKQNDLCEYINRAAGYQSYIEYDAFAEYWEDAAHGTTSMDYLRDGFYEDIETIIQELFPYSEYYERMNDDDVDQDELYEQFEESDEVQRIYSAANDLEFIFRAARSDRSGNYQLYANTDNLFELDAKGKSWAQIPFDEYDKNGFHPYVNTRQAAAYAKAEGFAGVKISNVFDDGGRSTKHQRTPATVYIFFKPQEQVKSADPVTYDDNGNVIPLSKRFDRSNDDIRFSLKVTDKKTLDFLNEQIERGEYDPVKNPNGGYIKVYRSFQVIDGKLYAPMNAVDRDADGKNHRLGYSSEYGVWEMSTESPEIAQRYMDKHPDAKYAMFDLDGVDNATSGVAYNPYLHASNLVLNDQFTAAYRRKLITVECYVPISEANGAYKAKYAKDATGWVEWKPGGVAGKLMKKKPEYTRKLFVSRYMLPVREVKAPELASMYKEYLDGTNIKVPWNVVTPELRKELVKAGVPIDYGKEVYRTKDKNTGEKIYTKFDEAFPGEQFSLKGQSELMKQNAKLKETVEGLREQFKTTKFAKVDKKSLEAFTKQLLKDYSSGADITETRDALGTLYTYLANGEDGMAPSWNEAYKRAYETAVSILEASGVLDDEMYQTYKDLRTRLKNRAISISSEYDHDMSGYESINDFRKANFGRLKISKDGTPVDIVYSELATVYPELFDEYTYTNQADQAVHIAEVLESLQPVEVNPYSYNMREHATWLANDIMERFFELPQAKPTFADKAEQRLTKQVIKDTKKLEKLRAEKNERIRQLIENNREKVKTAQAKERAKRQEAVKKVKEHYKEKESKASVSRKTRELRAKVVRHAEQMSKRLLSGTDKVNVPEVLKPAVAELLSCINLESNYTYDPETGSYKKYDDGLPTRRTEAFREIKKQYEAIAANNDIGMVISPDLLGVPAEGIKSMLDIVAGYKDIRLVDMNLEQLQTVYDVIRVVEHSILMAGKTLSKMRWQTIDSAADAFMADTMTRKTKRSLTEKHKMLDIETPYTFFSHFGEAGHGFYRMLRDAQDREQVMQDELMEKLAEVVSLEKRRKAEKDAVEFTTQRGDKLTLSKAHIMNIYLLNNRKQAKGHLLGGGIVQPKIGKIRKGTEAVLLTEMDLANLFTNLTKEERAIADGLQKLTLRLAEWGNDASMTVYGIKKFNDPDYWTIRSSDIGFNQTIEQGPNKARSIANMGSAKSVIPEARNPLDIDSVFEVFDRHASDMLCYSAWLAPMEDANRLFNYKFRDENWIPTGKTMKGIINRASGDGSTQYWMRLMEDIQNGLSAPADTATEHDVMKAIGNVKKASVSGNIRVVIQQPTAYARAMAVLDVDAALAGVAKGTAIKPSLDGWAKAVKYAPIAARKAAGGYEVSSNPKQLAELLYQPESALGKMKQGAKEAPLWAAGTADKVTWGAIWNACEWQVAKDNKNLKKGTDEFYEAVKVLFTEVIDQTQVVDGVLQRSQAMRSGSSFVKQMTAFTGEPTQGANMVIRAYDQLRYETDSKKRGKAIKKLSRAVSVYTFTAVLNAFAQSLVDGIRDDDDEKDYWEKVWAAFHGINGNEETWWDYGRNVLLASNVGNNMNPMSWLPVWKDVLSVVQGYSVERMDAASMGDFFDSVSMVVKTLGGDGKYTTGYAALKALVAGGKLLGSSSYNILRDVEGVIRTFQVETDDYMARYNTLKMMTKPANNMTAYAKLLYKAYENDPASYKKMYSDLLKSGVEADTIRSKMESLMKKSQGVASVTDLEQRFLPPAQQTEYDRMLNSIQRSGVWKQANGAQRDRVEGKVYDMVMDKTNESTMNKIEDGAKYGIDETDYLLYQLALSVVDKPSENGKYGSYTVAERADAITDTGLSDKEMAYLWYSSQTGDEEKWSDEVFDALDRGIDIETYIDFKAFESVTKADKNAAGKTISGSKKAKIRNYLNENAVDMDTFDFIFYEVMGYKD